MVDMTLANGLGACAIVVVGATAAVAWQQPRPPSAIGRRRSSPCNPGLRWRSRDTRRGPLRLIEFRGDPLRGSSPSPLRFIIHSLTFRNASEKGISAVQFGLVSFDIFDEFVQATNQIWRGGIEPGKSQALREEITVLGDFSLQTGFAYVSQVRFKNGDVWTANEPAVLVQIRDIQPEFEAKQLPKPDLRR